MAMKSKLIFKTSIQTFSIPAIPHVLHKGGVLYGHLAMYNGACVIMVQVLMDIANDFH